MSEAKRERKAMIIPEGTGKGLEVAYPESGTYSARLFGIYAIGNQPNQFFGKDDGSGGFGNKEFKDAIVLEFELPTEIAEFWEGEGEKPFTAAIEFSKIISDKSGLFKAMQAWNPKKFGTTAEAKAFNLYDLLGKACTLNVEKAVTKKGNSFLKIKSISPVMKGVTVPPAIMPELILDVLDYTEEELAAVPKQWQWRVEQLKNSNEYKTANSSVQTDVDQTGINNPTDEIGAVKEEW
jgi:hypothetical protein